MASPEEIALQEALSKGSSDLKFVLTRNDVSNELQGAFYRNGVTTIQKFSSFFRSEEDLIGVLKDSFDTDADTSLQSRAQVAGVICAWRETQTRQKRQAEVEAEMETREWTKPIPTGDYINMRNAFMRVHGKIEDKVTPSKEYLEKKLQELENGEFRAETMAEIVSKDEVDPDVMIPVFDAKGSLTVRKGTTTIPLPTGPEQLRRRLSVMVNAILMLAIKHPNREEIQDVTRDLFERYKDYVLGDYVWGLSSTDLHGNQIQTPPWTLVLSYEQAIRKKAYSLMTTDHLKLGEALEPKGQGQDWEVSFLQRKIQRQRSGSDAGWDEDMLSFQSGKVQLPEVQVQPCLQPMFQEGTQWIELQRRQGKPGHDRDSLTWTRRQCM